MSRVLRFGQAILANPVVLVALVLACIPFLLVARLCVWVGDCWEDSRA
jgi:hypothetical protein